MDYKPPSTIFKFFRIVKFKLASCILNQPPSIFKDLCLGLFSLKPATPLGLYKDDLGLRISEVMGASHFKVAAPRFTEDSSVSFTGLYHPINAYRFHRATINIYCPVISVEHHLVFPDHIIEHAKRVRTSQSVYREASSLFRVTNFNRRVKQGILIGGAGAFNWFHYVLECLPKVLLVDRLPGRYRNYPLLLPIECLLNDSFRQAFEIVSKGKTPLFLERSELALVDDLLVFDEISTAPFNMRRGVWPSLSDYRQHDHLLFDLIAELRAGLLRTSSIPSSPKRLFLVRPGKRRSYNQDELIAISSNYGFEPVSPELLSLRDQATLFANASTIIGASGAAWVGLIFAKQAVAGLSWLHAEYRGFCSYSSLASLLGHQLKFIECTPDTHLTSTDEAYSASYNVSPRIFEEALLTLIDCES